MKIIIAGAGEVGFHLARMLSYESQDIILIDTNNERLSYAETHIDVMTLRGNATSPSVLKEANVGSADLLIAVTSSETTNLTTAIIGKKLGAKSTIARISNTEFLKDDQKLDFQSLGIDSLISPEELAADEIRGLIKESAFTDTFDFGGGKLSLIGINLDHAAPIVGQTIAETAYLNPDFNFMPVAIQRNNETLIPRGTTTFMLNDHAYFVTQPDGIQRVLSLTGKERVKIKNIMILGGSRIGFKTARNLCNDYKIKLIEWEKQKCFDLADQLPKTLVIKGDGRNVELLKEEDIENMDAFIAVTGNSETNIMSCLVAKGQGVRKTIALVENMDYIHLSQTIGIDCMINKKLIAASNIFKHIREGKVLSLANLHGVDAEILEFEVEANSRITKSVIRELNFPRFAIIGGVIRDNRGYTVLGDFQIKAKDRVVVFSLPDAIHNVEAMFK